MNTMNFLQLIQNWHTKASDEDYFSKYVFEYLAFIAFLKKIKYIDAETDRRAIQHLKQDNTFKKAYLKKVNDAPNLREAWEKITEELDSTSLVNVSCSGDEAEEIKWWNCSSDHLGDQVQGEQQTAKGVIHGLGDWENMVEFWHSVRNNLFHGGKNPQDERDQLLIENGYKTLRPLVEIFLSRQG